jgi:hypothetical protein
VVRIARRAAPEGAGRARLREIAAEGERYLAGWDGALRVPRAERAVLLTAETSDGFAWAQLNPEVQELELELAPSPSLRVRVLEAEGRPAAGVPVALKRKPDVDSYAYARATTGRDGVATFRDALLTLAKAGESPLVVVELPLVYPPRATLAPAPAPLPVEPLELRLPPCGSLVVRVLDTDGEPVRGERKTLTLGALPPEGAEPSGAADPKSRRRLTCVDLAGATVRFPRVELGRRFGLHFDAGDEESEELFELDGPRASGELVTVDYAPYATMHFVTGRALDTAGRPLRALPLEAAVLRERESRGVRRSARHVESDAEGRFRVQIGERGQRVGIARLELRTEGDPALGIVCDVPRPLARGGCDLGDLALAPEQLIAAGTVRNERGLGVEEARVTVSVKADPSGQEERWKELGHDSLRSDDEGRFVLRGFGVSAGAELRIQAEKRGYMSLPVAARRGEERVVAHMALEGSLEGTLLLEPELAEVALVVVLRDSFGGVAQQECVRFGSRAEQRFRFQKVPSGAHELELTLPGRSAAVATLHDVIVAPGGGAQDPRLAPLDLRGAIPRLVLSVRDPSGAPIAGAHASWRDPGRKAS